MTELGEATRIIRLLRNHLPDSYHEGEDWNWGWDELSGESQDEVKAVRKQANEWLEKHEKNEDD